jgi:fibronectin type 3 domain-containing protein
LNRLIAKSILFVVMACPVSLIPQGCARNPDRGARVHPPTELVASRDGASVRLSWKATDSVADAEYNVYRSESSAGDRKKVLSTRKTSCVIPLEAARGGKQFFCVTASLNGAAESACSNQVVLEPAAGTALH